MSLNIASNKKAKASSNTLKGFRVLYVATIAQVLKTVFCSLQKRGAKEQRNAFTIFEVGRCPILTVSILSNDIQNLCLTLFFNFFGEGIFIIFF